MYGLLLQSAADHLKSKYGEEMWEKIRKEANMTMSGFATHNIYSETLMVDMAHAAAKITGDTLDTIMDSFGVEFVNFVGQFGYDRILKVLGRHMRDFLNGLDNLHEYLRFSYPKLKPPSFFVEDETKNGLTLTYRSKRRGFLHYVKGQIRQVGRIFYHTRVDIFVVANDYNGLTKTTHVKFRLLFDNKAFREVSNHVVDNIVDSIPLRPELLFELFPFHIVFSRKMEIRSVGPGLRAILPSAVGKNLVDLFSLERPLADFTWEDVLHHTNNVFQLVGKSLISKRSANETIEGSAEKEGGTSENGRDERPENAQSEGTTILHLKGQMMYMNEWDCIMFLGTPIMSSLDDMFKIGLYINDLSMHDSSRDLVLAGTQQSAELKLALDQEQEKSRLLEQSMIKLDQEMQRTDALLYQMIPKPVADRLRKGIPSVETCQVFDNVTILFSDVVGFTTICSQITPMEVVSMLNAMYTQFDHLSESHSVYKVETIGDAYMAVSGAPTVTKYHALHMCDMALDMRASMSSLINPSNNETMKIRIGVHTGTTVAGVVGMKMPRYCLFGDTVNTASRMETSGESMKIHISETTKRELEGYPYEVEERGSIEVKGKGPMKTYWLIGKKEIPEKDLSKCPFISIMEEEVKSRNREEQVDYSSSRLNPDFSQPLSSSPIPYSPVSYRDVLEDRASPGRKFSRCSGDGEALRMGSSMSPRGSRSGSVGCPFAMGLFGSPPGNSQNRPGDRRPSLKKNSIDITYSTLFNSNKPSTNVNFAQHLESSSQKTAATPDTHVTPSSKPSVPESTDSGISDSGPGQGSREGSSASHKVSQNVISAGMPNDKTQTSTVVERHEENDSYRSPPPQSASPPQEKPSDNDSVLALTSRAESVATIKSQRSTTAKRDNTSAVLNNNEDLRHSDTPVPSGNGNIRHKVTPAEQDYEHFPSDKRPSIANGTHVIKNEFGCLSRSPNDKNRAQRKSKTCHLL